MKKLVLFFAAAVAVSFASCGGQATQTEEAEEVEAVVTEEAPQAEDSAAVEVVEEAVEAPAAE